MYIKTFPICAIVVFDDSDDRAQLYNHAVEKLMQCNTEPRVAEMRETRHQLRACALSARPMHYPMQVYIPKTEHETYTDTESYTDSEGKRQTRTVTKTESVTVNILFSFTTGSFADVRQKDFQGCMKKLEGHTEMFNTAAGFDWGLNYHDGSGEGTFHFPRAGVTRHKTYANEPHRACLLTEFGENSGGTACPELIKCSHTRE